MAGAVAPAEHLGGVGAEEVVVVIAAGDVVEVVGVRVDVAVQHLIPRRESLLVPHIQINYMC